MIFCARSLMYRNRQYRVRPHPGFSLLELLVVLSIIGVLTYLGTVLFRDFLGYSTIQKDARTVVADMRAYRQQAIADHCAYRFVFDSAANTYTIEQRDATTGTLLATIKQVTLDSDLVTASTVAFFPKGQAMPATTLELRRRDGSDPLRIDVQSATGMVSMNPL